MIQGVSPDLPHTDRLPVPREWGLRLAAPLVRIVMRLSWRVTVHGAQHVPSSGPVILAANHIGLLDGPALVALTRRLTFAMVKREAFSGPVGQFLTHVGQISLNRREIDPQAIRRAIQVLRAGKVLGVFPEGVRGSGEVASGRREARPTWRWSRGRRLSRSQSWAPANPARARTSYLARGDRSTWSTASRSPCPDLHGRAASRVVAKWTEVVRERLADHVVAAQALTGLPLPGPPKIKSALPTV